MVSRAKALIQVKPRPQYPGFGETWFCCGLMLIKGTGGDRR
jgi:hypothetical protein